MYFHQRKKQNELFFPLFPIRRKYTGLGLKLDILYQVLYFLIARKAKHYQESLTKLQNKTSNHINAIDQIKTEIIACFL